ncbi:putative Ras-related and estrogen-regulated growth inhibitor-like protein [Hypsibius exemplaris]|uniref:small monomeric GTPase n=1 Tax=Hypsibius exemplaris TaxID=2072580 RepID=A0A9X6RLJ7_HYPEX|nr:putative Ras-related and estrogen-regulated growth inhibitor-like protein [Hypsibius exemplaris]
MSSPVFSLRILVMGDVGVGKSALSVRYLTRRYLGEYLSNTDVLYRCAVEVETDLVTLEILDSSCAAITNSDKATTTTPEVQDSAEQQINCQIKWSDAIIVLYSIISRASFHVARKILQKIRKIKLTTPVPIILLGNKTDIKHRRETSVNEGRKLSEEFGCQFYELSTAESVAGVSMSFDSLIREAQALRICHPKTFPRRSRTSLLSVSKMIGAMFGKATKKKRPSLSL